MASYTAILKLGGAGDPATLWAQWAGS